MNELRNECISPGHTRLQGLNNFCSLYWKTYFRIMTPIKIEILGRWWGLAGLGRDGIVWFLVQFMCALCSIWCWSPLNWITRPRLNRRGTNTKIEWISQTQRVMGLFGCFPVTNAKTFFPENFVMVRVPGWVRSSWGIADRELTEDLQQDFIGLGVPLQVAHYAGVVASLVALNSLQASH